MFKGKNIWKEFANMKYVYNLIVKDGKTEYADEYICSFQIINNYSVREIPKKYKELYKKLTEVK